MKLTYYAKYSKHHELKYLSDSMGYQQIVATIVDGSDLIVLFVDSFTNKSYIEKVIDKQEDISSINLEVLTDEEFETYSKAFVEYGILPESYLK